MTDKPDQFVGHAIEARRYGSKFVTAFTVEAAGQIARPHHVQDGDQPAERPRNRPQQLIAEDERDSQSHTQGQEHHDLGPGNGVRDLVESSACALYSTTAQRPFGPPRISDEVGVDFWASSSGS